MFFKDLPAVLPQCSPHPQEHNNVTWSRTFDYSTVRPRKKGKPINQVNFSKNYNELSKIISTVTKPINQVNFSKNYNELSKILSTVTKFSLSSFF